MTLPSEERVDTRGDERGDSRGEAKQEARGEARGDQRGESRGQTRGEGRGEVRQDARGGEADGAPHRDRWRRGVAQPLEFEVIDYALRRKADLEMTSDEENDVVVKHLRDEVEALNTRLLKQAKQIEEMMAEARRVARTKARQEWQAELDEVVARERERIAETYVEFAKQRAAYFAGVEGEVVRLALAIAARVLHREAKLDPLLLVAVVRVALEKVADDSRAVLHVPAAQVEAWRAALAEGGGAVIEVVGEERMDATECVLETSVGRVELGVVEQLGEIEKGFFDLLQQRPV